MVMNAPAIFIPIFAPAIGDELSVKSPRVNVYLLFVCKYNRGPMVLFHAPMNVRITNVIIVGFDNGKYILNSIPGGEQPSITADSYNTIGMLL